MDIIKLAVVFLFIVLLLAIKPCYRGKKCKLSLSLVLLCAVILTALLYKISIQQFLSVTWNTISRWETLSLLLVYYLVTFLQRMMVNRNQLNQTYYALSGIFNNRRINASIAPMLIGLLPSPAVAFMAGDIVHDSCKGYLDDVECTFVTSYYRHVFESCLPTYSSILLALTISGVSPVSFVLGMIPMVFVLVVLGHIFYLRKVPKETGIPPADNKITEWKRLINALWPIVVTILLILVFNIPVYISVSIALIMYFIVYKFDFETIKPYFKSAWEWNIMLNTLIVMLFKNLLAETGVIYQLPDILSQLPLPTPIIFALIFLFGTVVAGINGIIAMCVPMAFAAVPTGGMPLLVLVMSFAYGAMQISPTHVCLTVIAEHFKTDFGSLVRKTIPVICVFFLIVLLYYHLLVLVC